MEILESSTKKKWQKPEIMLLSQGYVTGGAAQHQYHENSITASHAIPPTSALRNHYFKLKNGQHHDGFHTKHFYYS